MPCERPLAVLLCLGLGACSAKGSPEPVPTADPFASAPPIDPACARRLETLHERVREIRSEEDGGRLLGLERSARWHRIDPVRSPDHEALIAFADAARDDGRRIYITVDVTDAPRTKRPPREAEAPPSPPIVIRLADTSDPATAR